jgi:pSer/pThr/pTyr-binding forkhead associated (FHA) protein
MTGINSEEYGGDYQNDIEKGPSTLSASGPFLLGPAGGQVAQEPGDDALTCETANDYITIDGFLYSSWGAGLVDDGSTSTLVINGESQGGARGVYLDSSGSDTVDVGAQGQVIGLSDAGVEIKTVGSATGGDVVDNSGRIFGYNGVFSSNAYGDNAISNQGDLSGTNAGVDFSGDNNQDQVENTGKITGTADAVYSEKGGGVAIVNLGDIASSNVAIGLADAASVTDRLDNSGQIDGGSEAIVVDLDRLRIANAGTIQGDLKTGQAAIVDLDNSGSWIADAGGVGLDLGSGGGVIINSGDIHAPIVIAEGAGSSLVNSGAIHGAISFESAAKSAKTDARIGHANISSSGALTNTGEITGAIAMTGARAKLTNDGTIYGNVTLGANSTLINDGRVDGGATLGVGDVVALGGGEAIGALDGLAGGDAFQFSGDIGHVAIDFVASASKTKAHDLLQFSADEFASYAAVQGAMTQDGADVVIALDARETIVLDNIHLSALVGADFKFV